MRTIKYGGAVTGDAEEKAIIRSIKKSKKTRNWQLAEEGKLFEQESAKFLGVKHGILTTSGSCAGLLALSALELPKGSEVIIPAVTFPTIFNIIIQCGLTPVVVDCTVGSYTLDLHQVEKAISLKTKAIIAVHALGNPVDMPRLMKIAKKHNIYVIEDNCDGWGTAISNKKAGAFGHISFTSFHAAHIVSMGVGGGVFTNNESLAQKVRQYRDWGRKANLKDKWNGTNYPSLPEDQDARFIYEKIGYNFQPLELQAAMGRVQLKKSSKIKMLRKRNFDYLYKHLRKYEDLVLPTWNKDADICWFAFPITVRSKRGPLLKHLEKNGIETRSMFSGDITKHPAYKNVKMRKMPRYQSNIILKQAFWISCHPSLTKQDLEYIVKVFEEYYA